ncbi:MAG: hypothetical protein IT381_03555 [Deltaproteobacteria bacterium]|nr:hypothetical protein [Deltaproteobacteria bacterium]
MKLLLATTIALAAAAPTDPLENAIAHMRSAQEGIQSGPKACADALKTQVKAARMQLELAKEAKDLASAQSTAGGLKELAQEAKQTCPARVSADIEKAIAALEGQPTEVDDDEDLRPEQPKVGAADPPVSDTRTQSTTTGATGASGPAKAFISPGPTPSAADVDRQVNDAAKVLARGFSSAGATLRGFGKRSDWVQSLEAGKCYAFVGVGGPSAKRMALYLWDPNGKRRADRKSKEPIAVIYHCPYVTGPFHLQAKVKRPESGYAVGVFVR